MRQASCQRRAPAVRARPSQLLAALLLLVTACSLGGGTYSEIKPGRFEVGGAYSLHTQVPWSGRRDRNQILLTIDGERLEALRLFAGVRDGAPLIPGVSRDQRDIPVFRAGMRALDVADLVTASYRLVNEGEAEARALRPAPFGTLDGFRFDFTFTTRDGLEKRGMALGAVTPGPESRLHLILFTAAAAHYFDTYRATIDALFASVETG